MASRPLLSFLALTLTGCSDHLQLVCTLIGCDSGLEIQVNPVPTTPFRVEASALGYSAVYTQECPDPADCTRIFLPEFTPAVVRIRLIVGADTTFIEATNPEYTEVRPNGPDCPPLCRIGHVTIVVPTP
jgi:hypothetical protein